MRTVRRLPFVVVLFFSVVGFSQDKMADSLLLQLSHEKEDTGKVNTLIALSKLYMGTKPEFSLSYATQAKDLSAKLPFIRGEANAYKFIGLFYYFQGKNIETLDNWIKSLNLFRSINDKLGISNLLNNIGSLYYNQADDVKALDYYLQSLTLADSLNDKLRLATVLQNIGNAYLRKKATHGKALQYLLRALPLSIEMQDPDAIVTVNTNLGEIYFTTGKIDSALYYFNNGLTASNKAENVSSIGILNYIGKAYAKKGDYERAISYQKQSVALAKKLNAQFFMGKSLLGLADTYFAQGDIPLALESYKQAESALKSLRAIEELKDIYSGLTNSYAKMGDFNRAFNYQTLLTNYKDSLYNNENDKKLSILQFDFDLSQKDLRINRLTKEQALKELDLQKQKNTKNIFAVAFLLILITAFVIYRSYRTKVKTNLILDRQKVQIENLMLNILPEEVATELKEHGKATPRHYDSASVLFTDFKSFTSLADKLTPQELIEELSDSFMAFDDIVEKYQLEKIKTIGDSYMCAGGIPSPHESYVLNIIKAGLEMQAYIKEKNAKRATMGLPAWELRVGVHVGPIVAGVVGKKKYAYDIWGNTVNIASRMESNSEPGRVNISADTYEMVKSVYHCSHRGKISAKNVGEIDMYFVDSEI